MLTKPQQIELLSACMAIGRTQAKNAIGKDAIVVIGNTGAGKSTFVNYLAGCKLEMRKAKDIGLTGVLGKVMVVKGTADGGPKNEIMKIGHSKKSQTFVPEIATVDGLTFIDAPGFLDNNRGAEINIANAVNIRAALAQASSVRVLVLINFMSLKADRARGLTQMLEICAGSIFTC